MWKRTIHIKANVKPTGELGVEIVKVFPGGQVGGPAFVRLDNCKTRIGLK
jgi:2-keto-3-deoxy-6-phosphogluconate aldolase